MKIKIKTLAPLSLPATLCLLLCTPQQAWAVPPATTTTTLAITSGATPVTTAVYGTAVTLTATVTANGAPVTIGQVNFCDASVTYCTDIHLFGTAQLTTTGTAVLKFIPTPGSHTYKAVFTGTSSALTSASTTSSLSVNAIPTTTTIAQSGSTGNYTLTATVTGTGSLTVPTGTVSFLDTSNANASLGTAPLIATPKAALAWTNSQSPATLPQPRYVLVSDFNGDGIPDLAFGSTNSISAGSLSILVGNGDGTFKPATNFAAVTNDFAIAAAPFVTGGPMDIIAVSEAASATNNAIILFGDGKGGGTIGTPFSLALQAVTTVVTCDFNGDGKQDFVVAGQIAGGSSYAIAIYPGKGDGTFGSPTLIPLAAFPTAIAVGNFHGGGSALDIAVAIAGAGTAPGNISVFLNDGAGDFSQGVGGATGIAPVSPVAGDFNGDGKLDLAVVNAVSSTVTILLGNGDSSGTFTAAPVSPATNSGPTSIAAGDFNGDGKLDLAVTNQGIGTGNGTITILLGNGDGTFTPGTSQATGILPVGIAAANFNADATADLAVANVNPNSTSASTLTVLLSQQTQTAVATAANISPSGTGIHTVDASYPGDTLYASSVSGNIGIGTQTTTLTLTATPTTSNFGQQVVLSATLTPFTAAGDTTNGETITFFNGATSLGTGTLASGVATLNTTSLPIGADSLTAKFAGDPNFNASTSSPLPITINIPATTTSQSSIQSTSGGVTTVVITVFVGITSPPNPAYGSVSLTDGGVIFATQTLGTNGSAVFTITTLTPGTHNIAAAYPGVSGVLAPSTSATDVFNIPNPAATNPTVTITPSSSSITIAQALSVTITVSGKSGGPTPTGSVTLNSTGYASAPVTLSNGSAVINVPAGSLPAGTDVLFGDYSPDSASILTYNAINSTTMVTVTAVAQLPVITFTPTSLTFAAQALTTQSAAQNLTLMNNGPGTLVITSITPSTGFAETSTCGATLAPGTPCTIAVKFTPAANGPEAGSLTIVDNATGSPHIVTLTGSGPTFTAGATSSSLNISAPGSPATTTINIAPVAGFTGTVNLTCTVAYTGPGANHDLPACTLNPTQVQITSGGATATSTLTVTTTAASASATPNLLWPRSVTALATLFLIGLLPRRRWKSTLFLAILSIATLFTLTGCGGGSSTPPSTSDPGTTTGSYQVSVTTTSNNITATTTIPLTLQ